MNKITAEYRRIGKGGLQGAASVSFHLSDNEDERVTVDGFLVHDPKEAGKGPWVSGPSKKVEKNGETEYKELVLCRKPVWNQICKAVLEAAARP